MVYIEFDQIKVENISNSSGIFTGDNIQIKWKALNCSNEGCGTLDGDKNHSLNNQNIVIQSALRKDSYPLTLLKTYLNDKMKEGR